MVTDFIFGIDKILVHFDQSVIFSHYFDHIWPAILYRAQSFASQRAHDSKCFNEVYKSYIINHILNKKFSVKPDWVKIRQTGTDDNLKTLDLIGLSQIQAGSGSGILKTESGAKLSGSPTIMHWWRTRISLGVKVSIRLKAFQVLN